MSTLGGTPGGDNLGELKAGALVSVLENMECSPIIAEGSRT
jgi:hypothetical protein